MPTPAALTPVSLSAWTMGNKQLRQDIYEIRTAEALVYVYKKNEPFVLTGFSLTAVITLLFVYGNVHNYLSRHINLIALVLQIRK